MTIIVGFLTLKDEAGISYMEWKSNKVLILMNYGSESMSVIHRTSNIEFREKFQLTNRNKNPSILILILR